MRPYDQNNSQQIQFKRRTMLKSFGAFSLALLAPDVFAEELTQTPRQAEGPYYPDRLPLDQDNDLIVINDSLTTALGIPLHLKGQVLDTSGSPIRNAIVEIWQCDANGFYLHTDHFNQSQNDLNFQGYGRFQTDRKGRYFFRTIKPVEYGTLWSFRTPHIHFIVKAKGRSPLTTQMYIAGESGNGQDSLWRGIQTPKLREALTVPLSPHPNSKIGELTGTFNIIMG